MTIVEFLTARLSETEALAMAATEGEWVCLDGGVVVEPGGDEKWVVTSTETGRSDLLHIEANSPRRVLADIAAKRAIVNYEPRGGVGNDAHMVHEEILCILASVYAEHPDYRQEWKP